MTYHTDFVSESLANRANTTGGFTFDVKTSCFAESGYAVALPGHEEIYTGPTLYPETIADYLTRHADALSKPNARVGGWATVDANGTPVWYLDVSVVLHDREAALALARSSNQLAIYNLSTGEEISCE